MASKFQNRTWSKDNYLISTDQAKIPIPKLNAFFASKEFYWAAALPEKVMRETVENSLCFGLYERGLGINWAPQQPNSPDTPHESTVNFIGIARCVTDFTTFVYLTDVYIDPVYQGKGLGTWLMRCVQEAIESMPYLRRSMLFTGDWKRSVPFYEKILGMEVVESRRPKNGEAGEGLALMMRKGRGHPDFVG
jgi:ribosomal protein S18 acetylase RimI-like enzyme